VNKSEAVYFLEGLAVGLAAPGLAGARHLYALVSRKYGIQRCDIEMVRDEINIYLDVVDDFEDNHEQ